VIALLALFSGRHLPTTQPGAQPVAGEAEGDDRRKPAST
jgi:hypothetical protein